MPISKSIFMLSVDLLAYCDNAFTAANKMDFSLDCNNNIAVSAFLASKGNGSNGSCLGTASVSSFSSFFFLEK